MAKKQISILIDEEILARIDYEAERRGRSRNWILGMLLEEYRMENLEEGGGVSGAGSGAEKKIADVLNGGGWGTPDLPRWGKAQDRDWKSDFHKIFDETMGVSTREKLADEKFIGPMRKAAETNSEIAFFLHGHGVELDREILIRWGLAENYKPVFPENFGELPERTKPSIMDGFGPLTEKDLQGFDKQTLEYIKNREETGGAQDGGKTTEGGGDSGEVGGTHATSDDGAQSPAVGVEKPGVDMDRLRAICAGNFPAQSGAIFKTPEPVEMDLCGFKSYNETDGENYICGKEKHGPKVKHGEWIKL